MKQILHISFGLSLLTSYLLIEIYLILAATQKGYLRHTLDRSTILIFFSLGTLIMYTLCIYLGCASFIFVPSICLLGEVGVLFYSIIKTKIKNMVFLYDLFFYSRIVFYCNLVILLIYLLGEFDYSL